MPSRPQLRSDRQGDALALARDTARRMVGTMRRTVGLFIISLIIGAALWVFVTDVENPTVVEWFPEPISVQAVNVSDSLAVANLPLPSIQVRVSATQDRWEDLHAGNFRAIVDMQNHDARRQEVQVQVDVTDVNGVRVVDVEPREIVVTLEELVSAEIPVTTRMIGTLPIGYELVEAVPDTETVTVTGPESLVPSVTAAVASVNVTGLTVGVQQSVSLQPEGAGGGIIAGVRIEPEVVRVSVDIAQRTIARTVPVTVEVIGEPGPGYRVTNVTVSPSAVQVEGVLEELQQLDEIRLPSINISGSRAEVVRSVAIPTEPGIQLTEDDRVTVTVAIEPVEGAVRTVVPVVPTNLADTHTATFEPNRIEVLLTGPLPLLNAIEPGDVTASVDLADAPTGTFSFGVELQAPEGVTATPMQSETVTVTITEP